MAPFSKLISCILLTTLVLPLQIINARESQFFSKVTPVSVTQTQQLPNNNKPEQEQPPFVPETSENSYGLYGHETPENYPPTTTTYKPYNTEFEDTSKYTNNKYYNFDNNNQESYNHQNEQFSNNNYYNKDSYGNYQNNENELSDTKYREEQYNNQMYFDNNNAGSHGNNNNNRYNPAQRQGMSDTRFMEGGKYYYDLDSEKYSTNNNHGEAYRGAVNNNNNNDNFNTYNYNNQGGNAYHGNYNSNQNNNQEFFEDEIDDTQP
ncbi:hypothetical protein PIB30_040411 [Stylosanthes scabra]|uniref:Protein E6 n=1 Tax=Stylosanthes scabra TaxID=79078 RepID=A0ABU6REQ0_9FABA|nr:hypothetical protein [Stylosanthes scabra]